MKDKFQKTIDALLLAAVISVPASCTLQTCHKSKPIPYRIKHQKINTIPNYKTSNLQNDPETVLLARMIFGEARSCSEMEKIAVAYTAINRANDNKKFNGTTLKGALLKRKQYSCFNPSDPNLEKLMDPQAYEPEVFNTCLEIAEKVKNSEYKDPTNGATHFHTKNIHPYWANSKTMKLTPLRNSAHFFYKEK
jgi:N-acetylmuramoyl-L-alanine amidase